MNNVNWNYLIMTIVLFAVETFIAVYIQDDVIRPYAGDVLVVILMYCLIQSFWKAPVTKLTIAVFLFASFIEALQFLNFTSILELENNVLAKIILGNTFEWLDILAYSIGACLILIIEKISYKR